MEKHIATAERLAALESSRLWIVQRMPEGLREDALAVLETVSMHVAQWDWPNERAALSAQAAQHCESMQWDCERSAKRARRLDRKDVWTGLALNWKRLGEAFMTVNLESREPDQGELARRKAALQSAFRYHRKLYGADAPKRALGALIDARCDVDQGVTRYELGNPAAYNPPCIVGGSHKARWIEAPREAGLRFVGFADQLCRSIRHTGWFTDLDFQDESLRGAVYQLPARQGRPVFVAAYADPCNGKADQGGPALFDFESVHYGEANPYTESADAKRDAALAADSFAERAAESEREFREASNAGQRWADLGAEITAARGEARQLVRELKQARQLLSGATSFDGICRTIRRKIESARESIAELRAERDSLLDSIPRNLREAFNESAGLTV